MNRSVRHIFLAVGLSVAAIVLLAIVKTAAWVILLLFGGVLLAILLRTLSDWVHRHTFMRRFGEGWSLLASVLLLVLLLAGLIALMAPSVADQTDKLATQLPQAWQKLERQVQDYHWGRWLFHQFEGLGASEANANAGGGSGIEPVPEGPRMFQKAMSFMWSAFYAATACVVILFVGLYLAAQPGIYHDGLMRLIPPARRERFRKVLLAVAHALRWWLLGRFASMSIIGVLTAIGLWGLGIPLALTLGVIAGILTFIPNLGPVLSVVPAVLLGFIQGPMMALWVVVLYIGIQAIESYVITPMIQERAVAVPPVLLITVQVLMGMLMGVLGLLLATPSLVVVIVATKMLYVRDTLGDYQVKDGV